MRDRRDIVVIAGGWSVSQYDRVKLEYRIHKGQAVIGVNDSALLISGCTHALSMDRLWTEGRWGRVEKIFPHQSVYIRKGVAKNFTLPPEVNQFENSIDTTMTTERGRLNGSNSGTCAVNLALQLALCQNIYRVFLLGFDMQDGPDGQKHWYPPYPWRPQGATKKGNFSAWAKEFKDIKDKFEQHQVRLINVNHRTQIKDVPCITFEEFLKS
jgi:hypothetical protein